jgi:ribonuclease D
MMGRTYATRLAVVQLGWPDEIALIDATLVDVALLRDLFNSDALCLTHAGLNDFDVLDADVGCRPRRFFDSQIAAQFLGWVMPSLATLASDLLDITLDKSEQRADWLARPLSEATLRYAASDVAYLHELHDLLTTRLREQDRLEWLEEECALAITKVRTVLAPSQLWWNLQRADMLSPKAQLWAQRLCEARDSLARELDRTPSSLLNDAAIVSLAKRPPKSMDDVMKAAGPKSVHRGFAGDVLNIFSTPGDPSTLQPITAVRLDDLMQPILGVLGAVATQRARDLNIDPGLLTSKNDLSDMLLRQETKLLCNWRRSCLTDDLTALLGGTAKVIIRNDEVLIER